MKKSVSHCRFKSAELVIGTRSRRRLVLVVLTLHGEQVKFTVPPADAADLVTALNDAVYRYENGRLPTLEELDGPDPDPDADDDDDDEPPPWRPENPNAWKNA